MDLLLFAGEPSHKMSYPTGQRGNPGISSNLLPTARVKLIERILFSYIASL